MADASVEEENWVSVRVRYPSFVIEGSEVSNEVQMKEGTGVVIVKQEKSTLDCVCFPFALQWVPAAELINKHLAAGGLAIMVKDGNGEQHVAVH